VTLSGSCLCGAIAYEIDGALGPLGHCHCRTCRKAHAAAFATTARVERARFRWSRGAELVTRFESSPGKKRSFCPRCGSQLIAAWDDQSSVIVRVGSLDSDPGTKPLGHVWTSQKAPWFEITDGLPQFPESLTGPPPASYGLVVVRVFVRDWPRALAFYRDTLGIPVAFVDEELGWAQLATGQGQLALERATPETRERIGGDADDDEPSLVGRFLGVSLAVPDVHASYEGLRSKGVEFLAPPEVMPWGGVLAHLRDPDGNVLTLVGRPRAGS
jgi:ADP-ribosyl-[dinitrogen reductase] hydrolase